MKAWNLIAADDPPLDAPSPPAAFDLRRPDGGASGPVVFSAPHGGRFYPPDMKASVDLISLRRLEDGLVDRLVEDGPSLGAPLLSASYGRAYLDVNRAPDELDPQMFESGRCIGPSRRTVRVAAGLGLIARVAAEGRNIYQRKLTQDEGRRRMDQVYRPYHAALEAMLTETQQAFGRVILIDWHSMPSTAAGSAALRGRRAVDVILGDRHGQSCAPALTDAVQAAFEAEDCLVTRNTPYAGGYTTEHYGKPHLNRHVLQIEINRALYLDEERLTPTDGFARLKQRINIITARLVQSLPELVP